MNHYYNEFDPKNVAWLRELMEQGHIPHGVIDGRSIKDVAPADVAGDGQRHFFAGIAGWCEALRLAGWPAERSVWTGSCPCQPFSQAGKGKGTEDERDLWPDFYRLIRECRPDTIFGEQVGGAIKHGWLDRVHADLEREGYAVGHCILGAHSVQAPHIRQRLYWVANAKRPRVRSDGPRTPRTTTGESESKGDKRERLRADTGPVRSAEPGGAANAERTRRQRRQDPTGQARRPEPGTTGGMGHTCGAGSQERICHGCVQCRAGLPPTGQATELSSHTCGLGDPNGSGPFTGDESAQADGHGSTPEPTGGRAGRVVNTPCRGEAAAEQCGQRPGVEQAGYWSDYRVVQCRDGKARRIPVEPAFQPLASRVPSHVVRLRGYGNAIVPQVAAVFIKAFLETEAEEK